MSAQHGRRSELPPNSEIAARLRAGETLDDVATSLGTSTSGIQTRLNSAGWGNDGHPVVAAVAPMPALHELFQWPPWVDRALCAQTDPEAFFPEKGGSTREAKAVCARCPVQAECIDYALERGERFGIWGGLSERERRRIGRATTPPPGETA